MGSRIALIDRLGYDANTGCWNWKGSCDTNGYGAAYWQGKRIGAHRFAMMLWRGMDRNDPRQVCHTCDNVKCFNPRHLFLATNRENQLDCVAKGRHPHKEKTHCINGHEFNGENTYLYYRRGQATRICRTCTAIRCNAYHKRKGKKP